MPKPGRSGSAVAAIAASGADAALLESAVAAVRATAAPPTNQAEDDRARSAAERFLFAFLESLPETAGRFELNAALDFEFGPRPAEVDLLCRSPRIAIELDGYFHFLAPDGYRRDRTKDWELQRRGFVVLRFLAEDVIPAVGDDPRPHPGRTHRHPTRSTPLTTALATPPATPPSPTSCWFG